jgi:hypothetical protein
MPCGNSIRNIAEIGKKIIEKKMLPLQPEKVKVNE